LGRSRVFALCLAGGAAVLLPARAGAAVHYDGSVLFRWLTGMPVLFVLWPGTDGAEPGARFEALLEGVQEAEARIVLERALDSRRLTGPRAARARKVLAAHFNETNFCQGNSIIHGMEEYHYGWQERSRRLYEMAAEAAGETTEARP